MVGIISLDRQSRLLSDKSFLYCLVSFNSFREKTVREHCDCFTLGTWPSHWEIASLDSQSWAWESDSAITIDSWKIPTCQYGLLIKLLYLTKSNYCKKYLILDLIQSRPDIPFHILCSIAVFQQISILMRSRPLEGDIKLTVKFRSNIKLVLLQTR